MKQALLLLALLTKLTSETYSLPPLPKERPPTQDFSPYITAGFSSLVIIPYIANTSVGIRLTKDGTLIGFDGSINFSTNFMWYNTYLKGLLPIYISPSKAKNSYYIGPFITCGKVFQKLVGNSADLATMNVSPDLEGGLSFGKNYGREKITSFWQLTTRCVLLERKVDRVYYEDTSSEYKEGKYKFIPIFPFLFRFEWGFGF